jgi:hypothetical protein
MTLRERLQELVAHLPENEISLAIRLLEALNEETRDRPGYTIENAPVDDEPFDPSEIEGSDDEPLISHEDVVRRFR